MEKDTKIMMEDHLLFYGHPQPYPLYAGWGPLPLFQKDQDFLVDQPFQIIG
jgi:hypothetical protein